MCLLFVFTWLVAAFSVLAVSAAFLAASSAAFLALAKFAFCACAAWSSLAFLTASACHICASDGPGAVFG